MKVTYNDFLLLFGLFDAYRLVTGDISDDDFLIHKAKCKHYSYSLCIIQPMYGPLGNIFTLRTKN